MKIGENAQERLEILWMISEEGGADKGHRDEARHELVAGHSPLPCAGPVSRPNADLTPTVPCACTTRSLNE